MTSFYFSWTSIFVDIWLISSSPLIVPIVIVLIHSSLLSSCLGLSYFLSLKVECSCAWIVLKYFLIIYLQLFFRVSILQLDGNDKTSPIFCLCFNNRANWAAKECSVRACAAGWWLSRDHLVFRFTSKPGAIYAAQIVSISWPIFTDLFLTPNFFHINQFLHQIGSILPVFSMFPGIGVWGYWYLTFLFLILDFMFHISSIKVEMLLLF